MRKGSIEVEVQDEEVQDDVAHAKRALQGFDGAGAERLLLGLLSRMPRNAEVMRLLGVAQSMQQRYDEAVVSLRAALELVPDDALSYNSLGNALGQLGDKAGAAAAFARASALQPGVAAIWFNLGKALSEDWRDAEALAALDRALTLDPQNQEARFLRANVLRVTGRAAEAADAYRAILREQPLNAEAWLGLSNLKQGGFSPEDIACMELARGHATNVDDEISIRFALARGYEDQDRFPEAFAVYCDANAHVRKLFAWSASDFSARVSEFLAVFSEPVANLGFEQGDEAVFIVSMPRSGSSLVEQILASHPEVDGAGELSDVSVVLNEESQARSGMFPHWVGEMAAADWQRLGQSYLQRTARWRAHHRCFTDKRPDNWRFIGPILTMLPRARIVVCLRDPVETALACFRQLFSGGAQPFSYDLLDIAAYWHDFMRAIAHWRELYPDRVRVQNYEALVADSETEVRGLLAFCGLGFDPGCLRFHETRRTVRTASASQVREPLRSDTARAAKYGSLLDPLRAALGLPPFAATQS